MKAVYPESRGAEDLNRLGTGLLLMHFSQTRPGNTDSKMVKMRENIFESLTLSIVKTMRTEDHLHEKRKRYTKWHEYS